MTTEKSLKALFVGLGLLGTVVTWGRTAVDGTLAHVFVALDGADGKGGNHIFPGTKSALRDSFTGLPPLDYLLRTLVVFFWEAVDGSHPAVTATGLYFVGQLFPIIAAIYLDSLRVGNGASTFKPSLWFLLFGAAAIGCSGSVWALVYTATSPTTAGSISLDSLQSASLVSSPLAATLLMPAEILGYVVPIILMGLPSPTLVSNNFQQWTIVAWNTFPILMFAFVKVGEPVLNMLLPARRVSNSPTSKQAHLRAVRFVGAVSIIIGFAMHVAVVTVSISTTLFSPLFADKYVRELNLLSLATPPLSLTRGSTIGDGIWDFMVWDQVIGYSFVIIVFLVQLRNVLRLSDQLPQLSWATASAVCVLSSLLLGAGTTVMAISWLRDEILFDLATKETRPRKKA